MLRYWVAFERSTAYSLLEPFDFAERPNGPSTQKNRFQEPTEDRGSGWYRRAAKPNR